ncbi:hypothetical protein HK100_007042, partial [Physocladia obscura]
MTKTRRDIGVERMGTYMLSGWVLTDTPCRNPGCNMPTFRTKDSSKVQFCCLCDDPKNPIPADTVDNTPHTDENITTTGDHSINTYGNNSISSDDDCDESEERPMPASTARSDSDRASKLLGEKLLSGWTMLADVCSTCHVTPLMEKAGSRLCVKCGVPSAESTGLGAVVSAKQPATKYGKGIDGAKFDASLRASLRGEPGKDEDDQDFWDE